MKKLSNSKESRTLGFSSDFCSRGVSDTFASTLTLALMLGRTVGSNDCRKPGVAFRTFGISSLCFLFSKSTFWEFSVVSP